MYSSCPLPLHLPPPLATPALSVYVTHLSFYPSAYFSIGASHDGLDVCIGEWSHRGDQGTIDRPRYRRQSCRCKSILTNPTPSILGAGFITHFSDFIPHSNPRNDALSSLKRYYVSQHSEKIQKLVYVFFVFGDCVIPPHQDHDLLLSINYLLTLSRYSRTHITNLCYSLGMKIPYILILTISCRIHRIDR